MKMQVIRHDDGNVLNDVPIEDKADIVFLYQHYFIEEIEIKPTDGVVIIHVARNPSYPIKGSMGV